MRTLKSTFKAASPTRGRRWDHKFTEPKFRPRFRGPKRRFARPRR